MIKKTLNQTRLFTLGVLTLFSFLVSAQDIPNNTATHVAIANGNWSNPATWNKANIPGEGAIVRIPSNKKVTYNVNSNAHIFIIKNEGILEFRAARPGVVRKLVVDTFMNTMSSFLDIKASEANSGKIEIILKPFGIENYKRNLPNNNNKWNANAVAKYKDGLAVKKHDGSNFANNIDGPGVLGRHSWDPGQASLCLMSMGKVDIRGIDKTDFLECNSNINASVNRVTLRSRPNRWKVGDKIAISATKALGKDEEFTINAVNGSTITLNRNTREAYVGFNNRYAYMANLTRNIVIRSHETSEEAPAITRRGHVMFMFNGDVRVENAAFLDLGRTNKSNLIDDLKYTFRLNSNSSNPAIVSTNPSISFNGLDGATKANPNQIENQRGRYAFHFHKTLRGENKEQLAIAKGNVVVGSPGWGMVHHDSHAEFSSNVVYDIRGGGMIAESGSETGIWKDNLVFGVYNENKKTTFMSPPPVFFPSNVRRSTRRTLDDDFRAGSAYGLQGRAVRMVGNVAASSRRAFHYQGTGEDVVFADELDTSIYRREAGVVNPFPLNETITRSSPALFEFRDNVSASCDVGFKSQGRENFAFHQVLSVVDNFTAWNIRVFAVYISSNFGYLLKNSNIHARTTTNASVALLAQADDDNINIANTVFTNFDDRSIAVAGGVTGTNVSKPTLNSRNSQFVFYKVRWAGSKLRAPYKSMKDARSASQSVTNGTGALGIIATNDAALAYPSLTNVRFTPNSNADLTINLRSVSPDYKINLLGQIRDRAGNRTFANYTPRDTPFIGRAYNFKNIGNVRKYIKNIRARGGDHIGDFTEYISDRTTGRTTAVKIQITLKNYTPASSSIAQNINEDLQFDGEHNGLEIFPNPVTNGVLYVKQNGSLPLSIYDVYGSKIKEVKTNGANTTIDVSNLATGLYFLRSEKEIKKFLIQ